MFLDIFFIPKIHQFALPSRAVVRISQTAMRQNWPRLTRTRGYLLEQSRFIN